MLIIFGDTRSLGQDEVEIRSKTLRTSVTFLGWWTLVTTNCYIVLYFLVHANSEGQKANVIKFMTLSIIPMVVIKGLALINGASKQRPLFLEIGLWLTLVVALCNTILGVIGATHFIRAIRLTVHFLLFIIFICLSLSFLSAVLFDVLLIVAYKKLLRSTRT